MAAQFHIFNPLIMENLAEWDFWLPLGWPFLILHLSDQPGECYTLCAACMLFASHLVLHSRTGYFSSPYMSLYPRSQ